MKILRLPVATGNSDDDIDVEEQWIAVLVHPRGMRKVLAETKPYKRDMQALGVLLCMVRLEARKNLFGNREYATVD